MSDYYTLPISFKKLLKHEPLPKGSEDESIRQNLYLILATRQGELKYDLEYGFRIWEYEFDNNAVSVALKNELIDDFKTMLERFEPRLQAPLIDVVFGQEQVRDPRTGQNRYKRHIELRLKGRLARTNETFVFNHKVFIGPFSQS